MTTEGIIAETNLGYTYNYFKTDRLGLLAVTYNGSGGTNLEVLQVNEFYAFGFMWGYVNLPNGYLLRGIWSNSG